MHVRYASAKERERGKGNFPFFLIPLFFRRWGNGKCAFLTFFSSLAVAPAPFLGSAGWERVVSGLL